MTGCRVLLGWQNNQQVSVPSFPSPAAADQAAAALRALPALRVAWHAVYYAAGVEKDDPALYAAEIAASELASLFFLPDPVLEVRAALFYAKGTDRHKALVDVVKERRLSEEGRMQEKKARTLPAELRDGQKDAITAAVEDVFDQVTYDEFADEDDAEQVGAGTEA